MIPPVPELERYAVGHGSIHLLLSHLTAIPGYTEFYADRSEAGDYLILDNSAHEHGKGNSMATLLEEAHALGAHEVVVPDVLFDASGTVESARQALSWLRSEEGVEDYKCARSPRLMLVPQGNTATEWSWCLNSLLTVYEQLYLGSSRLNHSPPVIGISKDYYNWKGGLSSLITKYVLPHREDGHRNLDVHCLGWPNDLWCLASVTRQHSWVRSTDSAKPFVYAKNRILLEPGGKIPEYPRRDPNYFMEELTLKQRDVAQRNAEVFRAAAADLLVA